MNEIIEIFKEYEMGMIDISSFVYNFEVFKNSNGKFLCYLCIGISQTGKDRDLCCIVDLEDGVILKRFQFDFLWYHEILLNVPKCHVLVGISGEKSLFSINYEDNWRVEKDIMDDIYESKYGICVYAYGENQLVALSSLDAQKVFLFDFEKKKVLKTWNNTKDRFNTCVFNPNISRKNGKKFLFVESLSKNLSSPYCHIIDAIKFICLYNIGSEEEPKGLVSSSVFFDYSGKYAGYNVLLRKNTDEDLALIRHQFPFKAPNFNFKKKEGIESKIFTPKYGYGDNFFLGYGNLYNEESNESRKMIASTTTIPCKENELFEIVEYENLISEQFKLMNRGRDIFILMIRKKNEKMKMIHLVNTKILKFINIDSDEKERIEYLFNRLIMETEKEEELKLIKISGSFFSFYCFKLFFLL